MDKWLTWEDPIVKELEDADMRKANRVFYESELGVHVRPMVTVIGDISPYAVLNHEDQSNADNYVWYEVKSADIVVE